MADGKRIEPAGLREAAARLLPPLFLLQPLLAHVLRRVVATYPELPQRLGPHRTARFLIDPTNLPFVLLLKPDPEDLVFRACPRGDPPSHDARIAAGFLSLLRLVDCREDGDAMFFARDLDISGNTEAVVSLRNAVDDVEGSVAATAADALGLPGRVALELLRRLSGHPIPSERQSA